MDFDQGAAKMSEVKVGGRKKNLPTRLTRGAWPRTGPIGRYFFRTPTLTYGNFATPLQKSILYLFGDQSPKHLNDF